MQDLINLISDIKSMEETVVEMKYDAKKAPLGKTIMFHNVQSSVTMVMGIRRTRQITQIRGS